MRHRDRRGRGIRGRLLPSALPAAKTRAQTFDDLVLETVETVERSVTQNDKVDSEQLGRVEFAVEDVPGEVNAYDTDVIEDRDVPLSRLLPGQPGTAGPFPRIVVYRRPMELRAQGTDELAQLIRSVVIEQVANLLGVRPEDIDTD